MNSLAEMCEWSQTRLSDCIRTDIELTFLAMMKPVGTCLTRSTVPPLPAPSSFSTSKSSLRKSRLNSTPSSRSREANAEDKADEAVEDEDNDGVDGNNGVESSTGVEFIVLIPNRGATCIGAGPRFKVADLDTLPPSPLLACSNSATSVPDSVPGLDVAAPRVNAFLFRFLRG